VSSSPTSSPPTSGETTTNLETSEDVAKKLPTAETGARPKVKSQDKIEDISSENGDKSADQEQDEVRKRRLERFGSSTATSE